MVLPHDVQDTGGPLPPEPGCRLGKLDSPWVPLVRHARAAAVPGLPAFRDLADIAAGEMAEVLGIPGQGRTEIAQTQHHFRHGVPRVVPIAFNRPEAQLPREGSPELQTVKIQRRHGANSATQLHH